MRLFGPPATEIAEQSPPRFIPSFDFYEVHRSKPINAKNSDIIAKPDHPPSLLPCVADPLGPLIANLQCPARRSLMAPEVFWGEESDQVTGEERALYDDLHHSPWLVPRTGAGGIRVGECCYGSEVSREPLMLTYFLKFSNPVRYRLFVFAATAYRQGDLSTCGWAAPDRIGKRESVMLSKYTKSCIAAGIAFASAAAHAQSSVTLYGIVDNGLDFVSNAAGSKSYQQRAGNVSTSRFGFRGKEDLGDGWSAIFWLENGFNAANGVFQPNDMFGRQASVGLSSNRYGTITMGRQYDFVISYLAPLSTVVQGWGGHLASHPLNNDNLENIMRFSNSVTYNTISYNGFKAGAMYGFSNAAGQFANNRAYSLGASYARGPLKVAAAFTQINRSPTVANPTGTVTTYDDNEITLGGRQQIYGVAGRYSFGLSSVGLLWTHSSTNDITNISSGGVLTPLSGNNLKFDNFEIDGHYFVTTAFSLGLSYTYTMAQLTRSTGNVNPHWHDVVAQADYRFSRRTDVYLEGAYQRVGGGNGIAAFNPGITTITASSSNAQLVVGLGIRHRF
jgi:general bacterial porin, GBP family